MIDYTSYHHQESPDVLVLELTGRLDTVTSEFLLDCIQGYIDSDEKKIVLDCRNLENIFSVGMGVIVRAHSRLKNKGGSLAIAGAQGIVAEALHIVRFDRLLHLFPTVDEAVSAIA